MNVMPAPSSQHQWYLARDGQQYGPLTDPELAKFVELGHLQPTDLLWREGFPDWRPALAVFPPQPAAGASRSAGELAQARPGGGAPVVLAKREADTARSELGRPAGDASDADFDGSARRRLPRLLKKIFLIAIVLLVAVLAYLYRADLLKLGAAISTSSPTSVLAATDRNGVEVPPLRGFGPDAAQMDANLQATPLWRILKREFPEWYGERLK